ncbi:MAG: hypothetical protein NVS1B5_13380 [Gemmatimonadaceae bacterium]
MGAIDSTFPVGYPDPDAAEIRLQSGMCALEGEPLVRASRLVENVKILEGRLSEIVIRDRPAVADTLDSLASHLDEVAQAALSGGWAQLSALADSAGVEEYSFITLLDYATRPALRAGYRFVTEIIGRARWERGRCPACGAPPALAELRGGEGERFLRCGRCSASWVFTRVGCPHCETRNHKQLRYLHGEGEESYRRVQTCDSCGGYVKEIAALDPLHATAILEIDLASAALDLAAVERGYHR